MERLWKKAVVTQLQLQIGIYLHGHKNTMRNHMIVEGIPGTEVNRQAMYV
jgi:hypothetical protein